MAGLKYPICRDMLAAALVSFVEAGRVTDQTEGDFEVLLEELRDDGYLDDEQWKAAMPR